MREKLFLRSRSLEEVYASTANVYQRREDKELFQNYLLTFAEREYIETAEHYFGEAQSAGYINTLLSLTDRLESSPLSNDERRSLLQALAICAARPKLFFGKHKPGNEYKSVVDFESEIQKFYRKWDSFFEKLTICQNYINRGTTDLDRAATHTRLNNDTAEFLKKQLDDIYAIYFFELRSAGLGVEIKPAIDRNLLDNCCGKAWLLPLAHVILIRDAQYQMIGRRKYKKEVLLNGKAEYFSIGATSPEQKAKINALTVKYALRLRDAMAAVLSGTCKTDCRSVFARYFYGEQKKKEQGKNKWVEERGLNILSDYEARMKIADELSVLDVPEFSVPSCHIDTISLKIAAQLYLEPAKLSVLKEKLPEMFWCSRALSGVVNELNEFDDREKDELKLLLEPLRTLLNPREYFSERTGDSDLSDSLRYAAKKLDPEIKGETKDKMLRIWEVFKDTLYFCDLTKPALLLSNAIDPESIPHELLFGFCKYSAKLLHGELEVYKKKSYMKKLTGLDEINLDTLTLLRGDKRYSQLMEKLIYQAAQRKSSVPFPLNSAACFERDKKVPLDAEDMRMMLLEDNNCPAMLKVWTRNLTRAQLEHLGFDLYSRMLPESIRAFERRVVETLVKNSLCVFRDGM